MDLDVVFLGTSASAPTARRGTASHLVRRGGDRLLFDCGEGTQRQLLRSSVGLVDLEEIFVTHLHADHYLGLPGMLKTFSLRMREVPLTVYGPPGLRDLYDSLGRVFGRLTYPVELVEVRAGDTIPHDGYEICAFPVEPRCPCGRVRARRGRAAGPLRRREGRRARRPLRPRTRRASARRDGDACRRDDGAARTTSSASPDAGGRSSTPGTRARPRSSPRCSRGRSS